MSNTFLNTDELAKHLSISKTTVYRLVESRKIVFYKIGGCIRFKLKDIEDYLERCRIDLIDYE